MDHDANQFMQTGVIAALLTLASATCYAQNPEAQFVNLGWFPGANSGNDVSAISGDGTLVVGTAFINGQRHAYTWRASTGLIDQQYRFTMQALTADGARIVGHVAQGIDGPGAGIFEEGVWIRIPDLLTGPTVTAHGISPNGLWVVGEFTINPGSPQSKPFRWSQESGPVAVPVPVGTGDGVAVGVSDDGTIVIGSISNVSIGGVNSAFRWTAGGGFSYLDEERLRDAVDSSNDCSIIVANGQPTVGVHTFCLWSNGIEQFIPIPFFARELTAKACTADGRVVVGTYRDRDSSNRTGAFIWDAVHGVRDLQQVLVALGLNLAGTQLTDGIDITPNGLTIVGRARYNNGQVGGSWIARLPGPGACCDGTNCTVIEQLDCQSLGRAFRGGDTACGTSGNPTACCRVNFNGQNGVSVQDIFDFIAAYFAGDPSADFNESGVLAVQDLFSFLAAYFTGCP
jgi:uncharacterized membrane protein